MDEVKCLDTYILCEIKNGNPKFQRYIQNQFIVSDVILAEFYWILLRDTNEETALKWMMMLRDNSREVSLDILLKGVHFRWKNRKQGISFFDAVGYIFAQENKIHFVTGDKEFKGMPGVEFIQK